MILGLTWNGSDEANMLNLLSRTAEAVKTEVNARAIVLEDGREVLSRLTPDYRVCR